MTKAPDKPGPRRILPRKPKSKTFTPNVSLPEVDFIRQKETKLAVLEINAYKECSYQPTINKSNAESRVFDTNKSISRKEEPETDFLKTGVSPESKKKLVKDFLLRMKGQMDRSNRWREDQQKRKQLEEEALIEKLRQSQIRASPVKFADGPFGFAPLKIQIKTKQLRKSPSVSREVNLSRSQRKSLDRNKGEAVLEIPESDLVFNFQEKNPKTSQESQKSISDHDFQFNNLKGNQGFKLNFQTNKKEEVENWNCGIELDEHVSLNFLLK